MKYLGGNPPVVVGHPKKGQLQQEIFCYYYEILHCMRKLLKLKIDLRELILYLELLWIDVARNYSNKRGIIAGGKCAVL